MYFALDQISRLKQLITVPLTVGCVAHYVTENLLKQLQKNDAGIDTSIHVVGKFHISIINFVTL